jgi:hypothetical protein
MTPQSSAVSKMSRYCFFWLEEVLSPSRRLKVPLQSWGWGARGRDTYFQDFESRERGDHCRPGRPSDQSQRSCALQVAGS